MCNKAGAISLVVKGPPRSGRPDYQHVVIDEFLCMVSGCVLETCMSLDV